MYITRLKKVGGSVMLAVPPAILKTLDLQPDSEVGVTIDNGCLLWFLSPPAASLPVLRVLPYPWMKRAQKPGA
ncbi:AbrB/MazE/SpoVT family DNA-binding domain-containing protein [Leclercia adecarboxylata]|uniref:AbrB/MazE/SpoVT family DNA-binding domain-containing protein n=1 Tax=Leclercia adecarboxylata TaxID=83655 RepID=UPI00330614B7